MQKDNKHNVIYSISFNADCTLMAVSTNIGYKVYTTTPVNLKQ